jgi:serine/threonine protein kinase
MTLAAGTKLGSYEVAAQIGAGGMGEVYRAHDTELGRDLAIFEIKNVGRRAVSRRNKR